MKGRFALSLVAGFTLGTAMNLTAAKLYVSLESTNPIPPYADWATAATSIQDAVDAAKAGDTVLVSNGVYAAGARATEVPNTTSEFPTTIDMGLTRVVVTNAIRLESVNGASVTSIDGTGGVRCVYLCEEAVMAGFTLTNGIGSAEASRAVGSGVYGGTLYSCTLIGNRLGSGQGGAAASSALYDCTLAYNGGGFAGYGGGASCSILHNCCLLNNTSPYFGGGGGAYRCQLYDCTLTGNAAKTGAGAHECDLYSCILNQNISTAVVIPVMPAGEIGGGAFSATFESRVYDSVIADNYSGFGDATAPVANGSFYNCTIVNNAGGIVGTAFNSIVYYNSGGNYSGDTTMDHCCTTPAPTNGVGNITGAPLLMDLAAADYRLREDSPCIDAGTNLLGLAIVPVRLYTNGIPTTLLLPFTREPADLLGNTRPRDGNRDGKPDWDIGAYEFNSFKPPRILGPPVFTPDGCQVSAVGPTNRWVRLQRSSDLVGWRDIELRFMATGEPQQMIDLNSGNNSILFYRLVVP